MGIQIGFSKADVAHLIVEEDKEELCCGNCYGCVEEWNSPCSNLYIAEYAKLSHGAVEIWVHVVDGYCWIDANHWGSNRNKILYILAENNIEYVEG